MRLWIAFLFVVGSWGRGVVGCWLFSCKQNIGANDEKSTDIDEKSYTLVNEYVRCSGKTPIFKGFNDKCRELCDATKDYCKFYASWSTSSWCETYSECPSESPAGSNENIPRLWKKDEETVEVTTTTTDSTSSSAPEIVDCVTVYMKLGTKKYADCQEAQKVKLHQFYMSKFQELLQELQKLTT